jgi:DNA-binding GntR family transcriptional regulator
MRIGRREWRLQIAGSIVGASFRYTSVKDLLLDRIEHGDLAVGDVIPSEVQLGAAFAVSRLTVRQALYELRVEGYVIREKGRGTFVRRSAV